MAHRPIDVAQVRLDNALRLFDEFVRATVKHPDAATLRGLERRFAERLQIQPSYWSQIKARARQIGERLARQFEQQCHKPPGWMDQPHDALAAEPAPDSSETSPSTPRDDDERFIVGLVLTYYRRHPQRARQRLLDLLGEVLVVPEPAAAAAKPAPPPASPPPAPARRPASTPPAPAADDATQLWSQVRAAVAPLKKKR